MPKKTKQAKLLAELRRKLDAVPKQSSQINAHEQVATIKHTTSYTLPTKSGEFSAPALTENEASLYTLIRKDLLYSLGLIVFMLAIEIGVWKLIG